MAHKEMRKSRVLLTAAGLFLGLGCLWVRVAVLQTALHRHFADRARENQEHHEKILPHRGVITDRRDFLQPTEGLPNHGRRLGIARDLELEQSARSGHIPHAYPGSSHANRRSLSRSANVPALPSPRPDRDGPSLSD